MTRLYYKRINISRIVLGDKSKLRQARLAYKIKKWLCSQDEHKSRVNYINFTIYYRNFVNPAKDEIGTLFMKMESLKRDFRNCYRLSGEMLKVLDKRLLYYDSLYNYELELEFKWFVKGVLPIDPKYRLL